MANRRTFTDYEKKTIYANGNGRCGICGKPIKFEEMTVDHKIPLSRGGTNAFNNLQPACRTCNFIKNSLDMDGAFKSNKPDKELSALKKDKSNFLLFVSLNVIWQVSYNLK